MPLNVALNLRVIHVLDLPGLRETPVAFNPYFVPVIWAALVPENFCATWEPYFMGIALIAREHSLEKLFVKASIGFPIGVIRSSVEHLLAHSTLNWHAPLLPYLKKTRLVNL